MVTTVQILNQPTHTASLAFFLGPPHSPGSA